MAKDIIGFYEGRARNQEGYTIDDISGFTDAGLEKNHCYIQWIFPLPEKSKAVPTSPILRQGDIDEFNRRPDLQKKMRTMFEIMLMFYGLNIYEHKVRTSFEHWHYRYPVWLTPRNHNFLRISRIIRSAKLLGLKGEAQMFYDFLCNIYKDNKGTIGPVTKQFWDEAITKDF
jgi:hypothetical protein